MTSPCPRVRESSPFHLLSSPHSHTRGGGKGAKSGGKLMWLLLPPGHIESTAHRRTHTGQDEGGYHLHLNAALLSGCPASDLVCNAYDENKSILVPRGQA